jgi:hypothetical protein
MKYIVTIDSRRRDLSMKRSRKRYHPSSSTQDPSLNATRRRKKISTNKRCNYTSILILSPLAAKNLLKAPSSVDDTAPSSTHSPLNVTSRRSEERINASGFTMIFHYCSKHGCRTSTCAALADHLCVRKVNIEDDLIF